MISTNKCLCTKCIFMYCVAVGRRYTRFAFFIFIIFFGSFGERDLDNSECSEKSNNEQFNTFDVKLIEKKVFFSFKSFKRKFEIAETYH